MKLCTEVYMNAVQGIQDEWFIKPSNQWFNYIMNIPFEQRLVYLTLILEDQVLNGGFHQYFSNGYGQFALYTIVCLEEINASEKSSLLVKALGLVNQERLFPMEFRQKLLNFELPHLFKEDDLFSPLGELDHVYFDSRENICDLLEIYLVRN